MKPFFRKLWAGNLINNLIGLGAFIALGFMVLSLWFGMIVEAAAMALASLICQGWCYYEYKKSVYND